MVQPPLANKISLAVQDFIYKVADDLTTIVDEALEAFEDAAEGVAERVKPVGNTANSANSTFNYSIYVDGHGMLTADEIKQKVEQAMPAPSKTGGSRTDKVTLVDALSVVYDYLRDSDQLGEKVQNSSKENALRGNRSGIASAFKTAVAKDIFGSGYFEGSENRF